MTEVDPFARMLTTAARVTEAAVSSHAHALVTPTTTRTVVRLTKPTRARCDCHGRATHAALEDGRRVKLGCWWCMTAWRDVR